MRMSDPPADPAQLPPEAFGPPTAIKEAKRKRRRRPSAGVRLHSAPGVVLAVAGLLVVVGVAVATAGYWPPRAPRQIPPRPRERLQVIGPVIMAVGLFIIICASTLLLEDRDHQRLLDNGGAKKRRRRRRRHKERSSSQDKDGADLTTPLTLPTASHLPESPLQGSELAANGEGTETCWSPLLQALGTKGREDSVRPSTGSYCGGNPNVSKSLPWLAPPIIKLNNRIIDPYPIEPPPLPQRTYKLKRKAEVEAD